MTPNPFEVGVGLEHQARRFAEVGLGRFVFGTVRDDTVVGSAVGVDVPSHEVEFESASFGISHHFFPKGNLLGGGELFLVTIEALHVLQCLIHIEKAGERMAIPDRDDIKPVPCHFVEPVLPIGEVPNAGDGLLRGGSQKGLGIGSESGTEVGRESKVQREVIFDPSVLDVRSFLTLIISSSTLACGDVFGKLQPTIHEPSRITPGNPVRWGICASGLD